MKRFLRLAFLHLLALVGRHFTRPAAGPTTRILYIKPDHLGDLLLATPVLAALRAAAPRAEITALVGPWSAAVLARNPDVDVLLTCSFPGFERAKDDARANGLGARLAALLRPYSTLARHALLLRATRYDAALIGRDDHWWGAALALLAGIPVRVGFAVPECRPFLSKALPWQPDAHVTVQGLQLVGALAPAPAFDPAAFAARFDPAPADEAWADAWLQEQRFAAPMQFVIIHPGTGGPSKLWFPERWAAVGDALGALPDVLLLLTGGPDEVALVEAVAGNMARPPLTLAGRTTVGQLAALLRRATLVLGVDSGPMHLAAAQATPTIHLYGPGDWNRFGPWGDPAQHVVLRSGVWCSPCGVFGACPRGLAVPECMDLITPQQVVAAAEPLLHTPPVAN